ncbi:MAG TPA: rhomboid family intramembrane serine protease [Spirochaetota bacterium]|nr:rhomboid family intramembrane serine protease [Spirochaetota bacterium]OPZ38583.1 MAG: Rhomboid protease GluP [Spirochaetes bacterium ADurb.BinA120]HNU90768.1 rhomboid family intramembrane serine protease [Spirochaetota bacterium]HPI14386.1 rhomboid family intramembrane serine protease [Spirochaetota bacterium]HPO44993.1 rhomboid family intramembrane serine protease [Spirochaetota bacterium]
MRQTMNVRIGGPLTPVVKNLLIINAVVFLFQQFASMLAPGMLEHLFGLNHHGLVYDLRFWQIATYMFLHGGWLHILFNLLGLWMFAGELETLWGSRLFLRYYLFCGIGAGMFIAAMNYFVVLRYGANPFAPYAPTTLGASGAIYGILLAYGLTWPNREVLLYFLIPVKMKYLVLLFGVVEFFGTLTSAKGMGGNISHIGHLGGLVSGLIFIVIRSRSGRGRARPTAPGSSLWARMARNRRLKKKRKEIDERIEAKNIIDTLLEKIAREGMSSLTREERRRLEWARRHYYPDDRETMH